MTDAVASNGPRVGGFVRRGADRVECQDAIVVGDLVCARPTTGPHWLPTPQSGVLAVCDGVGGLPGGHDASSAAALLFADRRPADERSLRELLLDVDRRLADRGGATTAAGILVPRRDTLSWPRSVSVFGVGDSRVYASDGRYCWSVTCDDVAEGNAGLTQALGGWSHLVPHVDEIPLRGNSAVIAIVSDGVYRHVGDDGMRDALTGPDPLGELWAFTQGATDDASAVVCDMRAPRPSGEGARSAGNCSPRPWTRDAEEVRRDGDRRRWPWRRA